MMLPHLSTKYYIKATEDLKKFTQATVLTLESKVISPNLFRKMLEPFFEGMPH